MPYKKAKFFFIFFLLVVFENVAAEPFCSISNSSACDVEQGSLTLNPLETEAFLSKATDKVCMVYFYSESCSHCANVKPIVDSLEDKYRDSIRLTRYDVSKPENIQLYNQLCALRDYSGKSIPLIGINDQILVGETEIKERLEQEIQQGIELDEKICPLENEQCNLNGNGRDPLIPNLLDLRFSSVLPIIILAGLGDGVNPCAFVILIFVMVFLQKISGSKTRLLKVTLTYIIAIFVTNFLLGLLYFGLSVQIGFPAVIRSVVVGVSLVAGLINIKDFFAYGKGISLGIPKSSKKFLMAMINKASVAASVVLGVSVAVLEAPCSIPIYLSVIEVLKSEGQTVGAVLPHILMYNLMFIVPLVIISAATYLGYKATYFESASIKAKRYMKLCIGLLLIGLAVALMKGWL
ncbi:MAG: thioredoxin domain-containing protein [Candidatus Woesearchaeota archaeon]